MIGTSEFQKETKSKTLRPFSIGLLKFKTLQRGFISLRFSNLKIKKNLSYLVHAGFTKQLHAVDDLGVVSEFSLLLHFVYAHVKQIATEQTESLVFASEFVRLFGLLQPVGILGAVEFTTGWLLTAVQRRTEMAGVRRTAMTVQGTGLVLRWWKWIIGFSWQLAVTAVRVAVERGQREEKGS